MSPSPLPFHILGAPKRLDHLPFVSQVLKHLQVAQIIDDRIPHHPDRELSTGTCVEALVLCILLGTHTLYRVAETLEPFDLELLFDQPIDTRQFNDDRLGRALDCLFEAGLSEINTALLISALEAYQLNTKLLHFDTTSISVYGQYSSSEPGDAEDPDSAPHVTHGFSKDYRPDLKQVVYGVTVSDDGFVPLTGRVTDGNRSDSKENGFNLRRLAEVLPNPSEATLVADSKLFSGENLLKARDYGLNVLTLLPRTVGIWEQAFEAVKDELSEAQMLREKVELLEQIEESGEVSVLEQEVLESWRGLSTELSYEFKDENKQEHRLELRALVVHSSQLEESKKKAREKLCAKEFKALKALDKKFSKNSFACRADGKKAAEEALKIKSQFYDSFFRVVESEEKIKRSRRGRPAKDEKPATRTVYRVEFEHDLDEQTFEDWLLRESCFILVSFSNCTASDSELLEAYKNQSGVEGGLRWTKGAAEVAPIFLEKSERIAALGLVYVLALKVYMLIQRQLRAALEKEQQTIPGNRGRTSTPTAEVLFRLMENTVSLPVLSEQGNECRLLMNVTTEKAKALTLLGNDLLEREQVIAQVEEPRRGVRGYKPKDEDYLIKPKRSGAKTRSRVVRRQC